MITNTGMTIFNKYIENRETKYQKSYIEKVFWEDSKGSNVLKSGLSGADSSTVYILFDNVDNYVTPKTFEKNKMNNLFDNKVTFQQEDIIVKGKVEEEFTTIRNLEDNYDFVRVITSVDTLDFGNPRLHHWKVGAK